MPEISRFFGLIVRIDYDDHRSGMNKKIGRKLEIFTIRDFVAAIAQHMPDKSFQLDPWLDDPFPDHDTESVVAFSAS